MEFSGRERDLAALGQQWQSVVDASAASRGRAVIVTGRRRVGKSRLVQEFSDRLDAPSVVFQATRGRNPAAERADLAEAVVQSDLPGRAEVAGLTATDWNQALRLLAMALPDDVPSLVVLDEVPWLMAQDSEFEGALQTVWDRHLRAKPVLMLLVGSALSVMESLQSHDRAFYGRAAAMTIHPLHLADVADMAGLPAADAVDAWLITGGFPEVVASWPQGSSRLDFLRRSLDDPLSPLLVSGQLTLLGEFPEPSLSRQVLEAVGAGERTYATIAAAVSAGTVPSGTLSPLLKTLLVKRALADELPLSTAVDTRNRRYRVADPYLRFWLAFAPDVVALAERGRADLALARVERSWASWRGRAVEPLVRSSLERLLPDDAWPDVMTVGGWWNRQNNPEIDLVGADRTPARSLGFVGSVKWHDTQPFDHKDFACLLRDAPAVPGASPDIPLVAVSRNGAEPGLPLAACWTPADMVAAWR
ncbi:MAG: AAA family ATPase [Micrococcales bacterium]|nr:AAA family ATPase [Micrococcales bacterium]